jgi:phasin family protein
LSIRKRAVDLPSIFHYVVSRIAKQERARCPYLPRKFAADYQSGIAAWFAIARPAISGFEAVVELNLQAARTALAEYEDKLKNAFNASNPAAGFAQQVAAPQEAAGKAVAYGRHLFDIAVSTQAEWAKVAQAQYEETDKRVKDVVGELTKHAGRFGRRGGRAEFGAVRGDGRGRLDARGNRAGDRGRAKRFRRGQRHGRARREADGRSRPQGRRVARIGRVIAGRATRTRSLDRHGSLVPAVACAARRPARPARCPGTGRARGSAAYRFRGVRRIRSDGRAARPHARPRGAEARQSARRPPTAAHPLSTH